MDVSITPTIIKVVLLDETKLKVYVFSVETNERFLAHIMKSISLVDKQLDNFDEPKKVDTVLVNSILEHDCKRNNRWARPSVVSLLKEGPRSTH